MIANVLLRLFLLAWVAAGVASCARKPGLISNDANPPGGVIHCAGARC